MTDKSKITWTGEQAAAIDFPHDQSACVTAAAGSGKTALLVERVVRLIREGVPADKLAILTFTRNAAEEFRSRMTAAIEDAARPGAADRIPREQIIRFRSAVISTINSFCLGILKENAELFGLPVSFTIAEGGRSDMMLTKALDNAMEYFYSDQYKCGDYARELLSKTFSYKDDRELRDNVKMIYQKITSLSDPDKWMNDCAAAYSSQKAAGTAFAVPMLAGVERLLCRAQTAADSYAGFVNGLGCCQEVRAGFAETVRADMSVLEDYRAKFALAVKKGSTIEAVTELSEALIPPQYAKMKAPASAKTNEVVKQEYDELKELFKKFREKYKRAVSAINDLAAIDKDKLDEELAQQHTAVEALLDVVRRLEKEYTEIKRAADCVDFADCERLLLDTLKSAGGAQLRKALSERYDCIIVDEFQDTNDIQYEIFRLISREENNLFFVGDIKQSIYAFRGGNPRIMSELCRGSSFTALPLNMNFRSRPEIIDTVNAMFNGVMTLKYGDVDYAGGNELTAGASYPANTSGTDYSSEIYLLDYSEKNSTADGAETTAFQAEARFAAHKIRDMINSGFTVKKDSGSTRKCSSGDFCILLRSFTHAAEYKKELEALGIPVNMQGGESYLGTEEISLIISFLKVIDNPMLDEELLKVLMSPLYSFTAEEAAGAKLGTLGFSDTGDRDRSLLHKTLRGRSLYACVKLCSEPYDPEMQMTISDGEHDENSEALFSLLKELHENGLVRAEGHPKCVRFIEDLGTFRRFAANNSIERLIKKIYDDTQFLSVISVFERGSQKLANIRLLLKYAADFENSGGGTLSDFLRYTDNVRGSSDGFAQALIPQDAADAVRIMTFHASKGLEMPIVILGGLGSPFSARDTTGAMVFSRTTGIGLRRIFIDKRFHCNNLGYTATASAQKLDQIGEELRLLYVAMTRAREKLIMLGRCDISNLGRYISSSFSPDFALSGSCAIDWILASLMRYSVGVPQSGQAPRLSLPCVKTAVSTELLPEQPEELPLPAEKRNEPDREQAERICAAIGSKYGHEKETGMRSKFTVTEIAHMVTEDEKSDHSREKFLTRPVFGSSKNTGASVGNAYHRIMEIIPLEKLRGSDNMLRSITEASEELVRCGLLTEEEYAAVKPENIAAFFESGLGKRMLSSRRCEREFPVFAEVPAGDIYVGEAGDSTETIVQGRVDMFFYEDDGIVMVDYKSDSKDNLEREFSAYAKQLKIYRAILPRMTGVDKISIYIYSFSCSEARDIDDANV